jgi:diguanylate cyclase (GGDEF)-like protein
MPIEDGQLAFAVLRRMDITFFKRLGPWRYRLCGEPSPTFVKFFRQDATSEEFWKQSAMLEFFLQDVEDHFERGEPDEISSGIWHESGIDGVEVSFVARALEISGEQLLGVRALGEEYEEKARVLQQARVNLLERRRLNVDLNEYKQKSLRDGLTGLFNRTAFDSLLRENMALSNKTGASLALVIIDVDDFKEVNDTYGHVAGDRVLAGIGRILQAILRPEDAACRYGGEEFAIPIQHATRHQATQVAEKIRGYIATCRFGDGLPCISVSVGCSVYLMDETPESFISRVDAALYEAKRKGKNRVVVN